jgi:hypothetical protein
MKLYYLLDYGDSVVVTELYNKDSIHFNQGVVSLNLLTEDQIFKSGVVLEKYTDGKVRHGYHKYKLFSIEMEDFKNFKLKCPLDRNPQIKFEDKGYYHQMSVQLKNYEDDDEDYKDIFEELDWKFEGEYLYQYDRATSLKSECYDITVALNRIFSKDHIERVIRAKRIIPEFNETPEMHAGEMRNIIMDFTCSDCHDFNEGYNACKYLRETYNL